jgi:alcohol dehydrogenase class IV
MAKLKFSFPTFTVPARVTYGGGSLRALASELTGETTLLFTSARPSVRARLTAALAPREELLGPSSCLEKTKGEPTWESVQAAAAWLRDRPCDRIVAIGGGSVLDWARLAWAEAAGRLHERNGRFVVDESRAARPELWLVPTTCATGAEAASVAVFSRDGIKVPVVSPLFVADRVFLDGHFIAGQPDERIALWLCDALSHAIEAKASIVPAYPAKEAAVSALWLILEQWGAPDDDVRSDRLMEASFFAGLAAAHCSVGLIHAWAHSLAAWGVPHALGNALGLLPGLTANAAAPALSELARRVGCGSVAELRSRVEPIVHTALRGVAGAGVLAGLESPDLAPAIVTRVKSDPCLRTNPHQPTDAELDRFVTEALAGAAVAT